MNILTISMSDLYGGAAIASYRLHDQLRRQGCTSHMLVGYVGGNDSNVARAPYPGPLNRWLEKFSTAIGLQYTTIASTRKIRTLPWYKKADVLSLHNLHGRYFNYLALTHLLRDKPAVVTLHDMWLFTDGNPFDPKFMDNPMGSHSPGLEWRLKRRVLRNTAMTVVAPSRWMAQLAKRSILSRFPIHRVPYGLDLDVLRPHDPVQARRRWDIPLDRVVLMAMAETLTDPRKGIDLLQTAMSKLSGAVKRQCVLLMVGHNGKHMSAGLDMKTIDLGYLESDEDKATAFSATDTLIFPTRADNFPLVILEALACGTPVVSFDVGGVSELVRTGQTGWLARAQDADDLAEKITQAVKATDLRQQMRLRCREVCQNEYDGKVQAKRYMNLFDEAIHQRARRKTESRYHTAPSVPDRKNERCHPHESA